MVIVMTGGGSGGHITPLLSVAHELKRRQPDAQIVYVGQTGDRFNDMPAKHSDIDSVYTVRAGKFRRYHGQGLRQLLDLPTMAKNVRDGVWVLVGIGQSIRLLRRLRPSAVFIKGGFVGVPVGLAAALLRIPYITHDSDALPGLANRIVARWAKRHTVAMPKEIYAQYYPQELTETVGIPLDTRYHPLKPADIQEARERLGVPEGASVLLVTGGGLGAQRINTAVVACAPELLDRYPNLIIFHLAGQANEAGLRREYKQALNKKADSQRVRVLGFIPGIYLYSAAADVIITRAGATSLAEFAAHQKPCVVVPNPLLTGGHQLKNAKVLAARQVVRIVEEDRLRDDAHALMPPLVDLLDHPEVARALGKRFGSTISLDAAEKITTILLEIVSNVGTSKT